MEGAEVTISCSTALSLDAPTSWRLNQSINSDLEVGGDAQVEGDLNIQGKLVGNGAIIGAGGLTSPLNNALVQQGTSTKQIEVAMSLRGAPSVANWGIFTVNMTGSSYPNHEVWVYSGANFTSPNLVVKNSSDKSQDYFKAISEELEKEYTTSTSRVDIENESFITKVIDNVVSAKTISISNDGKASIASALSAVLPYVQVKSTNAISTSIVRFSLSTFQTDIQSLANGSAVAGLLNIYKNDLSNYMATDQSTSANDLEPDVLLVNDSFATAEDTSVNVNAVNNDSFNPNASYSVTASSPSNGTVSVVDNVITYNPSLNYYGDDSFTYTVTQGSKSGTGTVTMTVSAVDDPPELSISASQSVDENTTPSYTVASAKDVDGEDQTLTMSGTDSESFDLSSTNILTFKTAPDFETKSSYTITFTVTDGITEVTKDVIFTIIDINEQIGFEVLKQIEVIKTVE